MFLQSYQIKWEYRKGDENILADALSRPPRQIAAITVSPDQTMLLRVRRAQQELSWDDKVEIADQLKLDIDSDGFLIRHKGMIVAYYVPSEERESVVKDYHEYPRGDHSGLNWTAARLAMSYYWPYMLTTIGKAIKTCLACQKNKVVSIGNILSVVDCSSTPLEAVHVDTIGLPKSYSFQHIMTFIDRCTRYAEAYPLANLQWSCVKKAYLRFFREVGKPKRIISDRYSSFVCSEA